MSQTPFTKISPAPAVTSMEEEIYGTLYPAINEKHDGLTPVMMSIRRALGSWYPFAQRQVSGSDRIAYNQKMGDSFRPDQPYPNSVVFSNHYPTFYNPYKDSRAKENTHLTRTYPADFTQMKLSPITPPRGCRRQFDFFNRCLNIHGTVNNCKNEAANIINLCPSFALQDFKQGKFYQEKVLAIDERVYRQSMKVSDYNQGRTVANVSNKTWRDGQRDKLRPDSMYADDRYADITQADIDAAKARIAAKKAQGKIDTTPQAIDPNPPYDWQHIQVQKIKNIYN